VLQCVRWFLTVKWSASNTAGSVTEHAAAYATNIICCVQATQEKEL
jgi:hypothetical protein